MYDGQDGIEHFDYVHSYESLYELCTAYRFKDIKTFPLQSTAKFSSPFSYNEFKSCTFKN